MTLSSGTRLGPYEILSPLGAGGMGEVYKARDPRLEREVAIKVLPASFSQDPDRLRRFEQEAKAAGALNHPNITSVFDIGTHDGAPYVVQELLQGDALRTILAGGKLSARKAIDFALQTAHGLSAAHERGIVHRDLKPENLFVTRDGRVKILDFGLAKLTHAEEGPAPASNLPTAAAGTEPGVVLGTLGYMSPEQVRGKAADARSDIFSFGAILYEMLSGKRAFQGDSAADTLSAILREDPPDLSVTNQNVSPGLERILRHCLEKNPEQRFRSAHDLAFDLDSLSATSGASTVAARVSGRGRAGARLPLAIAAALLIATLGYLVGRRTAERPPPSFQQLTFRRGVIGTARFAPDEQTFILTAAWEGGPLQTFSGRLGSPEATALTIPPGTVQSVSSSGDLLIELNTQLVRGFVFSGTLARVPLAGGVPRQLLENVHWADWSPDGAKFAVVRDEAGKEQLEFPAGHPLYATAGFVTHPRVSPRGDLVAFLDHPVPEDDGGSVAVVDLQGRKRTLSQTYASAEGLAWASGGSEVWFTAAKAGNDRALRAVGLDGHERLLAQVPGALTLQDTASDGRTLVTRDDARVGIIGLPPGEPSERDLSWLDWSLARDLSADGKTLLFDESGQGGGASYSVYLRPTDGSPAVRLGDGSARSLSPDGKWVIAELSSRPPQQLVLLPTGAGESRPLTHDAINHHGARWLPDGRRFVFGGNEPGRGLRLWVQDLAGGAPRSISPEGVTGSIAVSPDGQWIAATDISGESRLYPTNGGTPKAIAGVQPGETPARFGPDGRTLYVRRRSAPLPVFRIDLATGRRELWRTLMPADAAGVMSIFGVFPSADGRSYVYSYARNLSQLFLVGGLK
jgi:hypothetical protein